MAKIISTPAKGMLGKIRLPLEWTSRLMNTSKMNLKRQEERRCLFATERMVLRKIILR